MSANAPYHTTEKAPKRVFFAAVVLVFFCMVSAADSVGFVPYYIDGSEPSHPDSLSLSELPMLGEEITELSSIDVPPTLALPSRIKISAIGLDLPVQNPSTRDITALDTLLQKGPARYVDSAQLGEGGNMIIFAHSSHLPVVHNQMYKAFNKIPELKAGDTITLEGGGKEYIYSVTGVRKADASPAVGGASDTIDLSPAQGTRLTLVTCDTFTGKSARFILEADFVGSI